MKPEAGDLVALTPGQKLLWAGQRLDPGAPLYNMIQTFRIHGAIDCDAFARGLRALGDDADALRLRFVERDGIACQFDSGARLEPGFADLSRADDPEAELRAWIEADRGRVFDLSRQAISTALLKLAEDDYVWYVRQHHLVTDGRAFQLLYEAMAERYAAALEGDSRPRPTPSFLDYARGPFDDARLASAIDYWQRKCAAPAPRLNLYACEDRGNAFDRLPWPLPADLNSQLLELAAGESFASANPAMSLSLLWSAFFAGLLYRLTGERHIRLGQPYEARRGAAQKSMLGLMMEIGFIDVEVAPEDDLARLFEKCSEALLDSLRRVRNGIASARINRAYDVLLNFVTASFEPFAGLPTTVDWVHPGAGDREHRLRVQICDFAGTGAQKLLFEYSEAAFAQTPVTLLVAQLERLMRAWLEQPAASIAELPLLGAAERAVRAEFNDTGHAVDEAGLLAALARNAQRNGDGVAVTEGDRSLTHRQLHQRVRDYAAAFAQRGVGRGDRVAIDLPRGIAALAAMWAAFARGASFTPLEVSDPESRKRSILEDLQPRLVLAQTPVAGFESVTLAPAALPAGDSAPAPAVAVDPDDVAYMIYTSGSTGLPKAACMTHRGLQNYVAWAAQRYADANLRCWPLYSSLAFDLTLTSIFVPALCAQEIRIYPPAAGERDLGVLDVFADDAVDIVKLTPSHLRAVVARGKPWRRIAALILGGEDLPTALARQALELGGGATRIYNEYGPTEATVGCMIHEFDPALDTAASVPIGRPVWNMRVYLRDENGRETPTGVPGEMHLSGPQLLREYWQRHELTRRALYSDGESGQACYRSGDLALWEYGGGLRFLGRRDRQVKFRGVRIETGEVESTVAEIAEVDAAHVALIEGGSGERLVCYYSGSASEAELRRHVGARLPAAARPTDYLAMAALPLTRNGKIDSGALPLPAATAGISDAMTTARWSDDEQLLREIWSDVLQCPVDDPQVNFFDLGGDSLGAIRVVSRLERHGRAITPRQIFDYPTIASLAPRLAAAAAFDVAPLDWLGRIAAQPSLDAGQYEAAFPLSPVQQGILFHALARPGGGLYHSRVRFSLRSRSGAALDTERLLEAWRQTLAANPILRCELFWREFDEPLQAVRKQVGIASEIVDLGESGASEARARLRARLREPTGRRISLRDNRLLHLSLICLPDRRVEVVWEVHHVLLDGWSAYPLVDEWLTRCAQGDNGACVERKPDYAQFVAWLETADSERQRNFWRCYLGDLEEATRLTPDVEDGAQVAPVARLETTLSARLGESLRGLAAAQRITLSSIFHAAWGLLLSFYKDSSDVVFGTTVSGRGGHFPGIANMTGLCLNTLPVRVRIDAESSVRDWLRRLHGELMALLEFEHTPLPLINQCVDPELRAQLFDSVLTIENYPREFGQRHGDIIASELEFFAASHYPLDVLVYPEEQPRLVFEYRHGRIAADEVEQLARRLVTLLRELADDPSRSLIEILPCETERPESVPEAAAPAAAETVPALIRPFAAQSQRMAIVAPGASLDYATLWHRACAWGRAVTDAGAAADSPPPIAIAAHRHPDSVVAMLACLVAGKPFLPLDPALPTGYAESLLDSLSVSRVMSTGALPLPEWARTRQRIAEPAAAADVMPLPAPAAMAYVIHTSGSSGTPKSVPITQAQLAWSTRARLQYYGAYPVFLLLSPLFFDSAFAGLWATLASGGTLVLPDEAQAGDPRAWRGAIERHGVTHTLMLPSVYGALLETLQPGDCGSLAGVMLAGEACAGDIAARHFEALGEVSLYNEYGPTEATVWSHVHEIESAAGTSVPIGKPLPHIRQRIVDRYLRPVMPGIAGELLLGGPAVIDAYLGEDIHADSFVSLAGADAVRWYRTGDRVRQLAQGELEFLGRIDRQVKIRGQRIDPLQAEALIQRCSGVRECAVAALGDGARLRLCAWVVAKPGFELEALQDAIDRDLPPAARPGRVILLEEIPRGANRKVDYRRLSQTAALAAQADAFAAPRGDNENLLADAWIDVLGLEDGPPSRDTNFLDLGGDSLAAMQVVARLYRGGFELGVGQLVSARTLAEVAASIGQRADAANAAAHKPFDLVDLDQEDLSTLLEGISDSKS